LNFPFIQKKKKPKKPISQHEMAACGGVIEWLGDRAEADNPIPSIIIRPFPTHGI